MNGYNITYLVLFVLNIGIALAEHGTPKEGNNNVFVTLLASALALWLVTQGGLFN